MISVIVCSVDSGKLAAVRDNLAARLQGTPYEFICIHDAASLCEGYNRGVARSSGDILFFCHDDIEIITPDFWPVIRRHLAAYDLVGCVGTNRLIDSNWIFAGDPFIHGIVAFPAEAGWPADRFNLTVLGGFEPAVVEGQMALDGFFFAAHRRVLDVVRFDERIFDGFHVYDTDFTFAAYLAGLRIAVCKDILIAHQSGGIYDRTYATYGARFMAKYEGRLPVGTPGTRKVSLARNLDRAGLLDLFESAIGSARKR